MSRMRAEAVLEWAEAQEVTVTGTAAELSDAWDEMARDCEPTLSGYLRQRDEGRIIAYLRHTYTDYDSCLHVLADMLLQHDVDELSWEAEQAHRIIRRTANRAVRAALTAAPGEGR